ncbi:hypothetical protein CHI06_25535 [Bacillus sp. 7884-1]|nr:hypothetical protein CHI06_25535 [Bacillus sp. 7884-1]
MVVELLFVQVENVHIANTFQPTMGASKELVQAQKVWNEYGYLKYLTFTFIHTLSSFFIFKYKTCDPRSISFIFLY